MSRYPVSFLIQLALLIVFATGRDARASTSAEFQSDGNEVTITLSDDSPGLLTTQDGTMLYSALQIAASHPTPDISEKVFSTDTGEFNIDCKQQAQAKVSLCAIVIQQAMGAEIAPAQGIAAYVVYGEIARNLFAILPHTAFDDSFTVDTTDKKASFFSYYAEFEFQFDANQPTFQDETTKHKYIDSKL